MAASSSGTASSKPPLPAALVLTSTLVLANSARQAESHLASLAQRTAACAPPPPLLLALEALLLPPCTASGRPPGAGSEESPPACALSKVSLLLGEAPQGGAMFCTGLSPPHSAGLLRHRQTRTPANPALMPSNDITMLISSRGYSSPAARGRAASTGWGQGTQLHDGQAQLHTTSGVLTRSKRCAEHGGRLGLRGRQARHAVYSMREPRAPGCSPHTARY